MSKAIIIILVILIISFIGAVLTLSGMLSDYKEDKKELDKWRKEFRDKYNHERQD